MCGGEGQSAGERVQRSKTKASSRSSRQHSDGFTTRTIKQTSHKTSRHSGVKDWTCTVGLRRQTHRHIGAQTHTHTHTV